MRLIKEINDPNLKTEGIVRFVMPINAYDLIFGHIFVPDHKIKILSASVTIDGECTVIEIDDKKLLR